MATEVRVLPAWASKRIENRQFTERDNELSAPLQLGLWLFVQPAFCSIREAVLTPAIVGGGNIKIRGYRISQTGPENLHPAVVGIGGVVHESQNVASDSGVSRRQWVRRVSDRCRPNVNALNHHLHNRERPNLQSLCAGAILRRPSRSGISESVNLPRVRRCGLHRRWLRASQTMFGRWRKSQYWRKSENIVNKFHHMRLTLSKSDQ